MATTLVPRRMLLWLLIAVTALLFAGAGQALAAPCSVVPQSTTAVDHGPVAYADGTLTVARHGARKTRSTHPTFRSTVVVADGHPMAYADGLLRTHVLRERHQRRFLTRTA
jgi:hypothetical protein